MNWVRWCRIQMREPTPQTTFAHPLCRKQNGIRVLSGSSPANLKPTQPSKLLFSVHANLKGTPSDSLKCAAAKARKIEKKKQRFAALLPFSAGQLAEHIQKQDDTNGERKRGRRDRK